MTDKATGASLTPEHTELKDQIAAYNTRRTASSRQARRRLLALDAKATQLIRPKHKSIS
jgi:hypothetical protein